jgi:two-component system response regulator AtoC
MPTAKNGRTILLGEDDLEVRGYLETALTCQGYSIEVAQDGEEVLECLRANQIPISAVVLDIIMPRRDGIEALKEIRRFNRDIPIIMISGSSSPLNVVDAMKSGANDFLAKPIRPEDLRKALNMALEITTPAVFIPIEPAAAPVNGQILFGTSPPMRELQNLIAQIGWSEVPVLIQGETGTGKEVLARELHACSPRAKKSFLKLNCAALPSELVESELFGYERGAFTGAFEKKPGMFALADGGTILLDEIGDMDFKLQAKLLQVLQDREFQRLGGKDTIKVDVRIIAATHRDLEKAIAENNFREDLYYRLNVMDIHVPPLRERKEDIVPLAEFLVRKHSAPGAPAVQLPPALKELFLDYNWPGNVRELENMIRKLLVLREARSIEQELRQKMQRSPVNGSLLVATAPAHEPPPADIPAIAPDGDLAGSLPGDGPVLEQVARAKREAERAAIIGALKSTNWNRRHASVLLRIDYKALLYKMNKLSIKKEKAAPPPIQTLAEAASAQSPSPERVSLPVVTRRRFALSSGAAAGGFRGGISRLKQ